MSYRLMNELKKRLVGSSSQRAILKSLCDFYNDETGQCNPSLNKIKEDTEYNIKSITNCLKCLETDGVIEKVYKPGFSTQYRIDLSRLPLLKTSQNSLPHPNLGKPNLDIPNMEVLPNTVIPNSTVPPNLDVGMPKLGGGVPPNLGNKPLRNEIETKIETQTVGASCKITPPPSQPDNPPVPKTVLPPKSRKALTHHFDLDVLPEDWKAYCEQVRPDLDPKLTFINFSFYFKSGNGNNKVRSDKGWAQSWQNWVKAERNQMTLKPEYKPPNNGNSIQHKSNPFVKTVGFTPSGTPIQVDPKTGVRISGFDDPTYYE